MKLTPPCFPSPSPISPPVAQLQQTSPTVDPNDAVDPSDTNIQIARKLIKCRTFEEHMRLWMEELKHEEFENRGSWRRGNGKAKGLFHSRKPIFWFVHNTWAREVHPRISNWLTPVLVARYCDEVLLKKQWSISKAIQYIRENFKEDLKKDLVVPCYSIYY